MDLFYYVKKSLIIVFLLPFFVSVGAFTPDYTLVARGAGERMHHPDAEHLEQHPGAYGGAAHVPERRAFDKGLEYGGAAGAAGTQNPVIVVPNQIQNPPYYQNQNQTPVSTPQQH